jgi:hypothetical protein
MPQTKAESTSPKTFGALVFEKVRRIMVLCLSTKTRN